MNSNFINCSFNSNILIADGIAKIQHLDEKPFGVTYNSKILVLKNLYSLFINMVKLF